MIVYKKNKGIQLIRALCAFQVLLSHSLSVYQSDILKELGKTPFHFFYDGQCAVILFFVLSGFFYYNEKTLTIKSYTKKVISKSLHIFPPYWVSIILGTILCNLYIRYDIMGYNDDFTTWITSFWKQEICISTFLKALLLFPLENTQLINPPSWYLLVEIKMYFIMPILIHIFNKYSWIFAYLLIIIAFVSGYNIISICGIYTLGACIHKYITNHNTEITSFKKCILFLCIGILLLNIRNEIKTNIPYTLFIQSIGAGLLIYIFYNIKSNFNQAIYKILIFCGNISYEIYIFHFIILLTLTPFLINNTVYLTIATFAITIIVSYPLHKANKLISNKLLNSFNKL